MEQNAELDMPNLTSIEPDPECMCLFTGDAWTEETFNVMSARAMMIDPAVALKT